MKRTGYLIKIKTYIQDYDDPIIPITTPIGGIKWENDNTGYLIYVSDYTEEDRINVICDYIKELMIMKSNNDK